MDNQDLWQRGFCRMPNAIAEAVKSQKKAQAIGTMLWCVQNAQRHETTFYGMTVKRGQLCVTIKEMGNMLGISYKLMRNLLEDLSGAGLIEYYGVHHGPSSFTLITVCNYDCYNGNAKFPGTSKTEAVGEQQGKQQGSIEGKSLNTKEEREKKDDEENEERKERRCFAVVPVGKLKAWMLSQQIWADTYKMNHHLTDAELEQWVAQFVVHLQSSGVISKTTHDTLSHFSNWHAKRKEIKEQEERQQAAAAQKEREQLDERKRMEKEHQERLRKEQNDMAQRHLAEMRKAAENGDKHAQMILAKYNLN